MSIIGSTVTVAAMGAVSAIGINPFSFLMVIIGTMMDVLLDAVCITLSLKLSNKHYYRICKRCDSTVKWCCVKLTDRTTRKTEMELAAATKHQRKQPASSDTPTTNGKDEAGRRPVVIVATRNTATIH